MDVLIHLHAGWLIDGTGGPIKENVDLTIVDGVFFSISKPEASRKGGITTHIDLSDCTIIPGLVDCHVHLAMSGTTEPDARQRQLGHSFEQAKEMIGRNLSQHLSHGIVALRDAGDSSAHSLRYKKECLSPEKMFPSLKCAGNGWHAPNRYGSFIGIPPHPGMSLSESIAKQEGADHIKIINSGINSLKELGKQTHPQFTVEELTSAIRLGNSNGRKTMIHANGEAPVEQALKAGCHSLEHGFFMGKRNLDQMAEMQTTWVPTMFSMKACADLMPPNSRESQIAKKNLDHQLEQAHYAARSGVAFAVGTDSGSFGVEHGEAYLEELKLLRVAGLSIEETIRCATSNGARLLGLEETVGSIAPGLPATFLAVQGSPFCLLHTLHAPKMVYVHGISVL
jgi:imidazolonepropionase-like amidohydrolase